MKRLYTAPTLTVYGSVAALTKALLKGSGDLIQGFCLTS